MTASSRTLATARKAKDASCWLRLYIAGGTPNSVRAEENLRAALAELNGDPDELDMQVIDVFKDAKRALTDGVIVTPTLVGGSNAERLVIMGDLTDSEKLRLLLRSVTGRG